MNYRKSILKKHVGKGGPIFSAIGNGVRNTMKNVGDVVNAGITGAKNTYNENINHDKNTLGFNDPASYAGAVIKAPIGGVMSAASQAKKEIMGGAVKKAIKSVPFTPTAPAGPLTPKLKTTLSKEAPETLSNPSRGQFNSDASYSEALRKFKKNNNWASKN